MKNPKIFRWTYLAVKWLIAAAFFYAGVVKLADTESFALVIDSYGLVPELLVTPISYLLSVAEIAAAVGLVWDIPFSGVVLLALLLLFIVVLSYGIHMGFDIDCGCFGPDEPGKEAFVGMKSALVRDLFMVAGMVYIFLYRTQRARMIACKTEPM